MGVRDPLARTVLTAVAIAAVVLQACTPAPPTANPSASPGALPSPAPATASAPAAPTASPALASWVTVQDGAQLAMAPVTNPVEAGKAVTFMVSLTNERDTPLQFGWDLSDCFAFAYVQAFMPLEPVGQTDWTGEAAVFKDRVLTGTGGDAEHQFVEPLSIGDRLLDTGCPEVSGVAQPLAPGETTRTSFTWTAAFGTALPVPPPSVTFQALAFISPADTLVTVPPPPTSFPSGRWFTGFRELWVTGTVAIAGQTRAMASLGQVVDGALNDATFREFITEHPVKDCLVSLSLPGEQGRYLPAGAGWNLEESCDHPRRFIRAEIDPWTAAVKGLDVCDRCGR